MAQIRSKQISDFLSTVNFTELSTTDKTKIANAADTKLYIDAQMTDANADLTALENALSAEIIATNTDFTSVNARVSVEEGRVDAILLASSADKDSFAEIVSLINGVDTANDDAFASYALATNASVDSLELALSAEISSTNSDFVRVEAAYAAADLTEKNRAEAAEGVLTAALSAEISSTNSDFVRVEAAYAAADSIEKARAIASEGLISTELLNEVASIDTRLGSVSGDLVSSVDSLELALSAEIDATDADFTSVDTRATNIETLNVAQNASIDSLEVALAAEIGANDADFISVNSRVSIEEGRVDAILLASSADKDSFAEIVSLINAVDTTNDGALAAYVLSNNAALSAEISATDADFLAVNASVDSLELALSAEISATTSDVTSIDLRLGAVGASLVDSVDSLELALSAEISATNSDFVRVEAHLSSEDSIEKARAIAAELVLTNALSAEISATNSDISAHDGRLTSLEGYIMEDAQQYVESFVGNAFVYTVDNTIQDGNKNLVSVFVNGHKVEVSTITNYTNSADITLVNPGYVIDAGDNVVILYQGDAEIPLEV